MTESQLIYHITHIDNLPAIISDGCLWSDASILKRTNKRVVIGYGTIKRRRLEELQVSCYPTTYVGEYVPFYFCPRSPMLFVIHRKNSELEYQGGQRRIVHLVTHLETGIAVAGDRNWAFTNGNAGTSYTQFSNDMQDFDVFIDKNALKATDWRDGIVKERKQAEFLVQSFFPWTGIKAIGVIDEEIQNEVHQHLHMITHQPKVILRPNWYY